MSLENFWVNFQLLKIFPPVTENKLIRINTKIYHKVYLELRLTSEKCLLPVGIRVILFTKKAS